jgi:hypothetical protein
MKTLGQIAFTYLPDPADRLEWHGKSWELAAQAVRAAVIAECAKVCELECVDADKTQSDLDETWNTALIHAAGAIRSLK